MVQTFFEIFFLRSKRRRFFKASFRRGDGRLRRPSPTASFPRAYLHGLDQKTFSYKLHKGLEGAMLLQTFPKATVDAFVLVLESGGSKLIPYQNAHYDALPCPK